MICDVDYRVEGPQWKINSFSKTKTRISNTFKGTNVNRTNFYLNEESLEITFTDPLNS